MLDLSNSADRKKITMQMHRDIEAFCVKEFKELPRKHLGASIIGHECSAYGWNTFRWLKQEQTKGGNYRLFNRGHEEEPRFCRWLKGIGFEIREFDPETEKQYRINGAKGHFGGSLDAMAKAPDRYEIPEMLIMLGEFKTHSEKSFTKLAGPKPAYNQLYDKPRVGGKGVMISKPVHYKQMCSYGKCYGFKYGLYCAVNKDTDELYFEIVVLDWRLADDLYRKAEITVFSQQQLAKIAQTEAFETCQYCHFAGVCHRGEQPEKNCRSCPKAVPVENGEWFCQLHNAIIPDNVIYVGCQHWQSIV